MSFPNIFEIRGCMLIDMLLFLRFLEPCLNAAAMFGNLKQENLMILLLRFIKDKYIHLKNQHFPLKLLQEYLFLVLLY